MSYVLTLNKGVWYIDGVPLHIPHDGGTVNLPPLTALGPDGVIIPVAVDSTGALHISNESGISELVLQMLLSRPPDAIDVRNSGTANEQTYSGWKTDLTGGPTDSVWIINIAQPASDSSQYLLRTWAGTLNAPVKWSQRETLLPLII